LLRYSGSIVSLTQAELQNLDVITRKKFTLHGGFSRNSYVDRLYVPRKLGVRGLISVQFAVEHEKHCLASYVHQSGTFYMIWWLVHFQIMRNLESNIKAELPVFGLMLGMKNLCIVS